jgi:hypothetical protein
VSVAATPVHEDADDEGEVVALTVVEVALPGWGRVVGELAERTTPPFPPAESREALPEDRYRVPIPRAVPCRERRVAWTPLDPSFTPGGGRECARNALVHCS